VRLRGFWLQHGIRSYDVGSLSLGHELICVKRRVCNSELNIDLLYVVCDIVPSALPKSR
jgi:hypothetical protein